MDRRKSLLLAGAGAVLACALAVSLGIAVRTRDRSEAAPPTAVVLVPGLQGSQLVSVDLDTGAVIGRVRLRSLATDIAVDPVSGLVVSAQTGGLGADADDALAVVDPRAGTIDYVKLPHIDPSQVEVVGRRAIVLHSVLDRKGFVATAVDIASRTVVADGHVPEGSGLWGSAAGSVWTTVATNGPVPFVLEQVDPATIAVSSVGALGFVPTAVTSAGGMVAVLGGADGGGGPARAALLDAATGAVTHRVVTLEGLPHGAQSAVAVSGTLVIGDWDGEEPETPSLQVIDAGTLAPVRSLMVGGAPCALAEHGGSLLVVDRVAGTLASVDPRTGAVAWRAELGATDLLCSKIVVLPGRGAATRPR